MTICPKKQLAELVLTKTKILVAYWQEVVEELGRLVDDRAASLDDFRTAKKELDLAVCDQQIAEVQLELEKGKD